MCGILGIVDLNVPRHVRNLNEASLLLKERGPDDCGVWNDESCALGHRRLSIIDLSNAGHQPMVSSNERYVCVFNGEIYNYNIIKKKLLAETQNYKFKSNSDTEVLLESWCLWQERLLPMLDGMFVFAIWDKIEKTLHVARDRMGEKPLYYHFDGNLFAFASRPSAIFKLLPGLSKKYSSQGIRYFIESGYVPAPFSIHDKLKKLPAAKYLKFKNGKIDIHKYWSIDDVHPEYEWLNRKEDDLISELDVILNESVSKRMVSDVPLGAFLSGGIDSSLVVAIMSHLKNNPIKTFTIGFDEKNYDESIHASNVAKILDTDHYCKNLKVKNLQSLIPHFFKFFDEPFFDSAAFPTLAVSKLAKEHVTVCLTGDGGDELFGGYHYYNIMKNIEKLNNFPTILKSTITNVISILPFHQLKLLSTALQLSGPAEIFAFIRGISKDFESVFEREFLDQTFGLKDLFSNETMLLPNSLTYSEISMRLDSKYTLNDDYLQKTDVASMSYSLESRTPFLSPELIEWSCKLPEKFKVRGKNNKYLLRKLLYRYVPKTIVDRPKRGFGVPIDYWLRHDLKNWALEIINDTTSYNGLPIMKDKVLNLFKIHQKGVRNVHPLLWAILMLLQFNQRQQSAQ